MRFRIFWWLMEHSPWPWTWPYLLGLAFGRMPHRVEKGGIDGNSENKQA